MKALITRKIGMTTILSDNGEAVAVTLLSATPNTVTQLKDDEKDGYSAVQLGFEDKKNMSKGKAGHFKLAQVTPKIIREFRINEQEEATQVGAKLSADLFSVGDS